MATRVLLRTLISSVNQTLIPRSFTNPSQLLRFRPVIAIAAANLRHSVAATNVRTFSTRPTTSSLNDSSPNWSNRPLRRRFFLTVVILSTGLSLLRNLKASLREMRLLNRILIP
ncbi:hypothetical protein HanRHA438_Chr11g0490031 [Helianthus annuus]|nr:hypothetical protein HanRHA438_Chr11g0490031 [Helianthus annuus]